LNRTTSVLRLQETVNTAT